MNFIIPKIVETYTDHLIISGDFHIFFLIGWAEEGAYALHTAYYDPYILAIEKDFMLGNISLRVEKLKKRIHITHVHKII